MLPRATEPGEEQTSAGSRRRGAGSEKTAFDPSRNRRTSQRHASQEFAGYSLLLLYWSSTGPLLVPLVIGRKTRTLRTSSDAYGALGTARPTDGLFEQHAPDIAKALNLRGTTGALQHTF